MKDMAKEMFDVYQDKDVPEGTAFILKKNGDPIYMGPIERATPVAGCNMVLHPADFAALHDVVMRKRGKYH